MVNDHSFKQAQFEGILGVIDKYVPREYENYEVYSDEVRFWDARLGSYGRNDDEFLWMSILSNTNSKFILWLRWDRICCMSDPFQQRGADDTRGFPKITGMNFQTCNLDEAKYWFQVIFQLETLNSWMSIDRFTPQPDHLTLLQFDEYTRSWTPRPASAHPDSWQHPFCCCGKAQASCICGGRQFSVQSEDTNHSEPEEDNASDATEQYDSAQALPDPPPRNTERDSWPLSFRDARFDVSITPGSDGASRLDCALRRADADPTLVAHLVAATSRRAAEPAVEFEVESFQERTPRSGARHQPVSCRVWIAATAAEGQGVCGGDESGWRFTCSCEDQKRSSVGSRCVCKHVLFVTFNVLHRSADGGAPVDDTVASALNSQQRAVLEAAAAAVKHELLYPVFEALRGALEYSDSEHCARQWAASLIRRAAATSPAACRVAVRVGALRAVCARNGEDGSFEPINSCKRDQGGAKDMGPVECRRRGRGGLGAQRTGFGAGERELRLERWRGGRDVGCRDDAD